MIPQPGNRQMRVYSMSWYWITHLVDDSLGFYVMLVNHSDADPLIPAHVVKYLGKRKRRRYVRELVEGGLATANEDGSLVLSEQQLADGRWRYFGSPKINTPLIAISLAVKPDRSPLPPRLKREVIERDERICGLCGQYVELDEGLDIDHIVPVARGGTDDPDNLQVSHASCNRSKGARLLAEMG